jgi:hypothetical protein
MIKMFNKDPNYQVNTLKKWAKVIDAGGEIKDDYTKLATAIVLENTHAEFVEKGMVNEAWSDGMGAQGGNAASQGGGQMGSGAGGTGIYDYGTNDARIPTIVIPTVRRIFPELLAHECCGVQPMMGPVGFAFAYRARYGSNGSFNTNGQNVSAGTELGYNNMDSTFTGVTGASFGSIPAYTAPGAGSYWGSYAGTTRGAGLYSNQDFMDGKGAPLSTSEWAKIGTDMPMAKFTLEKAVVEATERKLAAHWSLELAEDVKKMHGLDVDSEMVNIISYELQAEIDRQLLTEMVLAAINAGFASTWSPVSADGRNQMERIGTIYTHILDKKQDVAVRTRIGPANFMVASPKVCALVERFQDFHNWSGKENNNVDTNQIGVAKVGQLKTGIKVMRDTFAGGNYILLGHHNKMPAYNGIIYCPYIPVTLMRAINPTDFSPVLGARTRYGILSHLFGSGNFYHFISVNDLTSTLMGGESSRVFTY